jgi:integrase
MSEEQKDNYKNIQDYETFTAKNPKSWLVYESTYFKSIQEARANLNRALGTQLEVLETKKEHNAAIKEGIDRVHKYLLKSANVKTSDSWRKLRRSFAYYLRSSGLKQLAEDINGITNPCPVLSRTRKPKKKNRMITVTQDKYEEILRNRQDSADDVSVTMIKLGRELGIRPCEATGIEVLDFDVQKMTMSVFIEGAKKTLKGQTDKSLQRGIDRILHVPISKDLIETIKYSQTLEPKDIKACQERIRRASKKLWPNDQRRFCLYSLRYTFGSNMKKQHLKRRDGALIVAAAMGHKCTSSMSEYGSIQSGVRTQLPEPDIETIKQVVDDRAEKYGFEKGHKFNPRVVLKQESVDKRDKQRQPSRKDISARQSLHYATEQARQITQRTDPRAAYEKLRKGK